MPAAQRSRQRLVRICEAAGDPRTVRLQLIDELRRTVGFDAYVFVLTDPVTRVGTSPLADVPMLDQLPRLIRLKYLTAHNRWTVIGEPPVALLGDGRSTSPFGRELAAHGIDDVASVVFRDRYGCWGFLDLWRVGARFGEDEAAFLSAVAGPVTYALRRGQAATFVERTAPPSRTGPVVLLLSPELDVLGQTPQTHEYLRALVPPAPDRAPVPASAYNVAAQLLAGEAGVDDGAARARVHLADGVWLTLRADRIGDAPSPAQRLIAITVEESAPAERVDLFSRAHGLSARETEVLDNVAAGADTREIAGSMNLSVHTVSDHLKSVFAKTGTSTRGRLLARALGG